MFDMIPNTSLNRLCFMKYFLANTRFWCYSVSYSGPYQTSKMKLLLQKIPSQMIDTVLNTPFIAHLQNDCKKEKLVTEAASRGALKKRYSENML